MGLFSWLLDYLRALLFSKQLEVCVVGLQAAGKTSFVNLLASGQFSEEMVPTVGFNMRKVQSGNVTIKVWDIGGQPRFRNMWERYCRGVSAIVFVVDSAIPLPPPSPSASPNLSNSTSSTQHQQTSALASATATTIKTAESKEAQKSEAWLTATDELHALLERPQLAGVPLLVLATKNDVPGSAGVDEVIRTLRLNTISNREVSCYSISSKSQANIDVSLRWLCARQPGGSAH